MHIKINSTIPPVIATVPMIATVLMIVMVVPIITNSTSTEDDDDNCNNDCNKNSSNSGSNQKSTHHINGDGSRDQKMIQHESYSNHRDCKPGPQSRNSEKLRSNCEQCSDKQQATAGDKNFLIDDSLSECSAKANINKQPSMVGKSIATGFANKCIDKM